MSPQRWEMSRTGQHIELGIAEMNLFLVLAAAGLATCPLRRAADPDRHALRSLHLPRPRRAQLCLLPGCALHGGGDAVRPDARPEGGAHQSISTPLIGMAQDGLASFEPAFLDELCASSWAGRSTTCSARAEKTARPAGSATRRAARSTCASRPAPSSRSRPQHGRGAQGEHHRRRLLAARTRSADRLAIIYMGAVAPEAIEAAGLLSGGPARRRRARGHVRRPLVGRMARGPARPRARRPGARAHVETLLSALPRDASIITLCDGHPEALSWIGAVAGHRVRALGVEHFGQSGSISELYAHYGLDANAILRAAEGLSGRPVRYRTRVA